MAAQRVAASDKQLRLAFVDHGDRRGMRFASLADGLARSDVLPERLARGRIES